MSLIEDERYLLSAKVTTHRAHADSDMPPAPEQSATQDNKAVYGNDLNQSDMLFGSREERTTFQNVLEAYGLGRILKTDVPHTMSTTSRKLVLTTSEGKYFLKEKAAYCCSPQALKLSADFQELLAAKTPFVPHIRRTTYGEPYAQIGSRVFLLTEFKQGRLFRGNADDIASAAQALAQVHLVSLDFSDKDLYPVKNSADDALLFTQMAADLPKAIDDQWREEAIGKLFAVVQNAKNLAPSDEVPYLVNHGDVAPFNVVFGDNGVVAINDFDNCAVYPRVRDLADPMITFCDGVNYAGGTSSFRRPISQQFNLEKAKLFLESYQDRAGKLLPGEKEMLVVEVLNRWTELMALGIVRGDFAYYDVLQALAFPDFVRTHLFDL